MGDRIKIVGAGPAGASLAYFLKDTEIDITVYEVGRKPGLKPCGWAVPALIEKIIPIPEDVILSVIYGHRVFINGRLVLEEEKASPWGYIIDKPKWLSNLLKESGATLINRKSDWRQGDGIKVVATGNAWEQAPKDRIRAVSIMMKDVSWPYDGKVEIWFDTSFIGYFWVFPHPEGKVDVGVGGFHDYRKLMEMLREFVNNHPILKRGVQARKFRGAEIIVSGLRSDLLNPTKNTYAIGEAVGAVYPLSGEGIRPAVLTSKALADSLLHGIEYKKKLESTGLAFTISIQKLILDTLRNISPEDRLVIMRSVPREWVVRFGLGDFDLKSLLKLILRKGAFSSLISKIIVGKEGQ